MRNLLGKIDDRQRLELSSKIDQLLTQKDKTELIDRISSVKTELTRQIYLVGVIQFLAIVGSVIGIMTFVSNTISSHP